MSYQPCQNTSCKSYGTPHPNCRCYASGGTVCAGPHDAKCPHFADGGEVQANHEFQSDPSLAVDHAIAHNGLLHTLTRTGFTKSDEPGRAHAEFLDSSRKGRKALHSHAGNLLDPKVPGIEPDRVRAKALENKLGEFQANPDHALQIGGNLGDTLPMHHAVLGAKAGQAMTYLGSIKPKPTQSGPLDPLIPVSKTSEKAYERQVAIAEDPNVIFGHIKSGTLVPQDLVTLSTLYPKLRQKMADHGFEMLTKAKDGGRELSQKEKKKVGILIGEPMTYLQSAAACQAIMRANAPQLPMPPPPKQKKASGVELKQINSVNKLSETPLQKLQSSK